MSQAINVELTVSGQIDVLRFIIEPDNPEQYVINLNDDSNQTELKKVFAKLLELLLEGDVELNFVVASGYTRGLYVEVCKEYIADLNKELSEVKEQLKQSLSNEL